MSKTMDQQLVYPNSQQVVEVVPPTEPSTPEPVKPTDLTEKTFDEHLECGYFFIKFYAPWCGHSKDLAPIWEELAISFNHEKSVGFANVDCSENSELCSKFDITGYPTLLWFENGKMIEKYTEAKTLEALTIYVTDKLNEIDCRKEC